MNPTLSETSKEPWGKTCLQILQDICYCSHLGKTLLSNKQEN